MHLVEAPSDQSDKDKDEQSDSELELESSLQESIITETIEDSSSVNSVSEPVSQTDEPTLGSSTEQTPLNQKHIKIKSKISSIDTREDARINVKHGTCQTFADQLEVEFEKNPFSDLLQKVKSYKLKHATKEEPMTLASTFQPIEIDRQSPR